jgi:hypothetical protein
LDNVYPEKFIHDERVIGFGELRVVNTDLCLDTLGVQEGFGKHVSMYSCQGGLSILQVFYQFLDYSLTKELLSFFFFLKYFSLTKKFHLRREDSCCFAYNDPGSHLSMRYCAGMPDELWNHTAVNIYFVFFVNVFLIY